MKRVIVVYEQYGEWSSTKPFDNEIAAEKHARLHLREQTHFEQQFREDRSHKKHIQLITIDIDENAP